MQPLQDTLGTLIDRVQLRCDVIELTLHLRSLMPPDRITDSCQPENNATGTYAMKRRGVETRLVLPGEVTSPARADSTLLRAMARGAIARLPSWLQEKRCQPSRPRPERGSVTATCITWSRWGCLPRRSWKRFVQADNPPCSLPSGSRTMVVSRWNGTLSNNSLTSCLRACC